MNANDLFKNTIFIKKNINTETSKLTKKGRKKALKIMRCVILIMRLSKVRQ